MHTQIFHEVVGIDTVMSSGFRRYRDTSYTCAGVLRREGDAQAARSIAGLHADHALPITHHRGGHRRPACAPHAYHGSARKPCFCLMPAEHAQSVSGARQWSQVSPGEAQYSGGPGACLLGGGLLLLTRLAALRKESKRRSRANCACVEFGPPGGSPCSSRVSPMPSSARTLCEEASASGSSWGACRRACTSPASAFPLSWLLAACEAWCSCHLCTCTDIHCLCAWHVARVRQSASAACTELLQQKTT